LNSVLDPLHNEVRARREPTPNPTRSATLTGFWIKTVTLSSELSEIQVRTAERVPVAVLDIGNFPEIHAEFCLMYLLAILGRCVTFTSGLSILSGNPRHRQGAIHPHAAARISLTALDFHRFNAYSKEFLGLY
jgi:hypothetical protein